MSRADEIFAVYLDKGSNAYGGERISQLEHALQTAMLAEGAGADASLIVASLLHDYGHLVRNFGADVSRRGIDDRHETIGAENLTAYFGEAVTMPIRMHVEAKRYLCATDPEYSKRLSDASIWSLKLQGGAFAAKERDEFIKRPFAAEAVTPPLGRIRQNIRTADSEAGAVSSVCGGLSDRRALILRFTNWPRALA
jgi:[1-hydroxy-2-(trimethylamino)ethyl]phosphonate dioxygenase